MLDKATYCTATNEPSENIETSGKISGIGREEENVVQEVKRRNGEVIRSGVRIQVVERTEQTLKSVDNFIQEDKQDTRYNDREKMKCRPQKKRLLNLITTN